VTYKTSSSCAAPDFGTILPMCFKIWPLTLRPFQW